MKNKTFLFTLILLIICVVYGEPKKTLTPVNRVREMVDKTGFAQYDWQIKKIIERIEYSLKERGDVVEKVEKVSFPWKALISPHDDFSYAGPLYTKLLKNLKAKTIIMFGVAHKAKSLGLRDKIIFGSYKKWHGPFKPINVSSVRDEIIGTLPKDTYTVSNKMVTIEHSLEALIPFIQYYNRDFEIVPILVPYISAGEIGKIAPVLARVIFSIVKKRGWKWGKDFAIAISSDSVHYGDRNWGGKNFAKFGADKKGYKLAMAHEKEIINNCLTGSLSNKKIQRFIGYTVQERDYTEYKWTWCGRYSIPFGLSVTMEIEKLSGEKLSGKLIGYSTSIDHPHIKVDDLKMGVTAPANIRHWVGYTAIGYKVP